MKQKKIAAFTLIELTIYIAILSVITIIVADSFLILNKGRGNIEAKSDLNSNFHFISEKIKRDLSSASALNTPATAGVSASNLDITVGASSIKYALSSGRVTRQVDAATPENVSSLSVNVTSLNFLRLENVNSVLGKKRISVEISLSAAYNSQSPDWQYSQSAKTTVDLNQDF